MRISRLILAALISATVADRAAAGPEDSVVRVFASVRLPNPMNPWAKRSPIEVMGTGVVIEGKSILTNAHIVTYASEVFIQPARGGDRMVAKVASIGHGIDLAVLTLEDESFFEKRPPLPRAEKPPAANDPVVLMGFPVGGSGLAVTRGIVSRIDYSLYSDLTLGLRIQVDAAAGPGNSGGPALVNDKMIGLVFRRAENIGIVIPNEEIDTYLEDVKDGRYDGKPRIADSFQPLVNEALRKKLGLARSDRGVLVTTPWKSDASYPLREGDVLTKVGSADVDNEGLADYEGEMRLPFMALASRLAKAGEVPVRLIRDGKPIEVNLPTTREDDRLVQPYQGQYPSYFVHGPLVFSPVIEEAMELYARGNPLAMVGSPISSRNSDRVAFPGESLVVVTTPMLGHPLSRGYHDPFGQVVKDVDGVPVKNLPHLIELIRDGQGEFLTIHFFGDVTETLVFPRKAMNDATADLMADNGIPRRGTDNEMAVWNAKPATASPAPASE